MHAAATFFTMYSCNFSWAVRTLRVKGPDGRWKARTPAMSAGLTDHVRPLRERLVLLGLLGVGGEAGPFSAMVSAS